jgi:hypothetical protein
LCGLAVEATRGDQIGVVLENIGTGNNIDYTRLGEWLAGVEGLCSCNVVVASSEEGYSFEQDAGTLDGRCCGPFREGIFCGLDGEINRPTIGFADVSKRLVRGWVDGLEGLASGLSLAVVVQGLRVVSLMSV